MLGDGVIRGCPVFWTDHRLGTVHEFLPPSKTHHPSLSPSSPLQDPTLIRLDCRFNLGAGRAEEISRHRVLECLRRGPEGKGARDVVVVGDVPGDEAPGESVTSAKPIDDFDLSPGTLHRLAVLSHGDGAETYRPAGF